ncbi:MAG: AMP-binding protein [Bacteroidia bacterium]
MNAKKKLFSTDWAAKWAVYRPDKPAIKSWENRQVLTYAELNDQGQRLAGYLVNHRNLKKGDRIAVLAEFSIEYVLLLVAAQKTGLVLVPLNYRLTGPELDFMLKDSRPKMLLYEEKFSALIDSTADHDHLVFEGLIDEILEESQQSAAINEAVLLDEDDPIFILYTSGTTGFPKGAIYTHGMLFWNSINTSMSLLLNAESRTINCMPPFHTGGWNVLLSPLLHHGGYCCLVKKFDAAVLLQLLEEEKPSLFMAVPTMLKMMTEQPAFSKPIFPVCSTSSLVKPCPFR